MLVGIVKESKAGEHRVGMIPENVKKLVAAGNEVVVEDLAGVGSGFTNEEYVQAGAKIVSTDDAWNVDLVVKVKEPLQPEYKYFKQDLIIWGFLHLAASKECVEAMQTAGVTAIAGETIVKDGVLTLLQPMSAIAGRRALFMGAYYLEKQHNGEGILISGIPGIDGGNVVILGGGNAAVNTCDMAVGIGANVTILELNEDRIAVLKEQYKDKNVTIIPSTTENLEEEIKKADIFVSTILIPGAKPPKIVKEYMVKTMKKGSVIIDISIDQGGTVETIDTYTTHGDPVFEKHGVIHYAVPNMPGAVPRTATYALSNGNVDYLVDVTTKGLEESIKADDTLASGVNMYKGKITYDNLASTLDLEGHNLKECL